MKPGVAKTMKPLNININETCQRENVGIQTCIHKGMTGSFIHYTRFMNYTIHKM